MIANARMYAINERVASAWRQLFEWIARDANVPLEVVAHAPPLPLSELWLRDDLGCAPMCGYPWATWKRSSDRPIALAAPIPSLPACKGRPIYWTDIVARADRRFATIDNLHGARFAFTVEDSQSGYQAPRSFFAEHAMARGGRMFGATVGPLYTPRRVVDAIVAGDADAGPLDAWWHALLRRHEPTLAAQLVTLAATPPTPIPLMVCAADIGEREQRSLAAAFQRVADATELANTRNALLLEGFARPSIQDYQSLVEAARAADAVGYHRLH
jgi:ABC-type phosphate/phosphonate transport system substrate-binding protein